MRKKSILLFIIIFSLLSSIAFAEENNSRWFWINSTDTRTAYIDKETITYDPAKDMVDLWEIINIPGEQKYIKIKVAIDYKRNMLAEKSTFIYNYNDDTPVQDPYITPAFCPIIPDTIGELLRDRAAELTGRDEKLAEYNKQQQNIKEQKEKEKQEQAEQKEKAIEEQKKAHEEAIKKAERKTNVNTAIGILGSLF